MMIKVFVLKVREKYILIFFSSAVWRGNWNSPTPFQFTSTKNNVGAVWRGGVLDESFVK